MYMYTHRTPRPLFFSRCFGTSASVRVRGLGLHAPFVPKWRLRALSLHVGMGTAAAWAGPPLAAALRAVSCGLARAGVLAGLGSLHLTWVPL